MPARSDLELDMINYSVTMNKYTMRDTLEKALSLQGERPSG